MDNNHFAFPNPLVKVDSLDHALHAFSTAVTDAWEPILIRLWQIEDVMIEIRESMERPMPFAWLEGALVTLAVFLVPALWRH